MSKKLPKLIVILGPTASGKSGVAIELAKKFNGEIVCADSRTIYKWMNIGTAKPVNAKAQNKQKRGEYISDGVRHHLVDVVYPYEEFSLADFKEKAIKAIKDIIKRGKVPFLVGGTGLYIDAIVKNLEIPNIPPDKKMRVKLEKESLEKLMEQLKKIDPKSAEKIGENKRRIIRALEVCIKTGKKFSEIGKTGEPIFDALQIGITIPRPTLYKRIDSRAEDMFKNGLVKEVSGIVKKLPPKADQSRAEKNKKFTEKEIWALPGMSGIGYKQVGMYLREEINLEEAERLVARDTRHYAKRQITWFKRDKKIRWIKNKKEAEKLVKIFLGK
jgi:tRNA dimethylallyltransferase